MLRVHFVRNGDGPRLVARGTHGMYSVVRMHIPQELPCTNMLQGSLIRIMTKNMNGKIDPTVYEDWRKVLGLPLQRNKSSSQRAPTIPTRDHIKRTSTRHLLQD